MSTSDDYYAFFMREIVRDVPGEYGIFLPMETWEEVNDNFIPKLEVDERFRGLMVNLRTPSSLKFTFCVLLSSYIVHNWIELRAKRIPYWLLSVHDYSS